MNKLDKLREQEVKNRQAQTTMQRDMAETFMKMNQMLTEAQEMNKKWRTSICK